MAPSERKSGRLPETCWSLVGRAGAADERVRAKALSELLSAYAPGLRRFLMKSRGLPADLADELLQGFICDKVLAKDIVRKADRERGKFRNFLLKSLSNYAITKLKGKDRLNRHELGGELIETIAAPVDQDLFDREWVRLVVADALALMQSDCKTRGRIDLWEVLRLRLVDPMLHDRSPASYTEVVERLELDTPRKAIQLLASAKRCFTRHLTTVVGRYVQDGDLVEREIANLLYTVET